MGQTQTGSCPKCGAPIYCESPWWGIIPPPPIYTCDCHFQEGRVKYVTTTNTDIPKETEQ